MNSPLPTSIQTWQDCDQVLAELRRIEAEMRRVDAVYDRQITDLQERKQADGAPLLARRKALEEKVAAFAQEARAELPAKQQRKVELAHGTLTWRKSAPSVKFEHSADFTITALKGQGLLHCIAQSERVDKKAVRELDDRARALVGVRVEQRENLKIKLNDDPLVEEPARVL